MFALQVVVLVQNQLRPPAAVVHWARSGQPVQPAPKVTLRFSVIVRVSPAGQVTVPATGSTVKSSRVKPPGTADLSAHGLTSGTCPAPVIAASASPVP